MINWLLDFWNTLTNPAAGGRGLGGFFYRLNAIILFVLLSWLLMFGCLSCAVRSAPVPTYPKEKIIGTWEYHLNRSWPEVKFTVTINKDGSYRWEGKIPGDDRLWDWGNGVWTYDGRHLVLWSVQIGIIVHSSSTKNILKCHYIRDFSGARLNERINLYRRK